MKKPVLVICLFAAAGAVTLFSDRPAAADDQRKGTATCHKMEGGGKRRFLKCFEKVTYEEGRRLCYNGHGGDVYHFESPGPTCFAIINGDVNWPEPLR